MYSIIENGSVVDYSIVYYVKELWYKIFTARALAVLLFNSFFLYIIHQSSAPDYLIRGRSQVLNARNKKNFKNKVTYIFFLQNVLGSREALFESPGRQTLSNAMGQAPGQTATGDL